MFIRECRRSGAIGRCAVYVSQLAIVFLPAASAQSIYGTLTGIVSDPSGAVLPGANLILKDENSGSQRDTVANGDGYYTFVSLPPGSYELSVAAKGFEGFKQTRITVRGGDKMNVNVADLAPVDSGEKSDRLTTAELDNFGSAFPRLSARTAPLSYRLCTDRLTSTLTWGSSRTSRSRKA
jgi:hypothetical protein